MAGKETATQRKRRLEKEKIKRSEKLAKEGADEKRRKLELRRSCAAQTSERQTSEQQVSSLKSERLRKSIGRSNESTEQKQARLEDARQRQSQALQTESAEQRSARLEDARQRQSQALQTESAEQRSARLEDARQHQSQALQTESDEQRSARLEDARQRQSQALQTESAEQRSARLEDARQRQSQALQTESAEQRSARLEDARQRQSQALQTESAEQRSARLEDARQRQSQALQTESAEQRSARLEDARQRQSQALQTESAEQRSARLEDARQRQSQAFQTESAEQRSARLEDTRQRQSQAFQTESAEQRSARLEDARQRQSQALQTESTEQRSARLERARQARVTSAASIDSFNKTVWSFSDRVCRICTKRCYPYQVTTAPHTRLENVTYLPFELNGEDLELCNRCHKHVTSAKRTPPSVAYWNNLEPGDIPDEIRLLSQAEQRLVSRIIPFIKIIKMDGIFGQFGCKGQAVLFAQDIFEVTDRLPIMLPRSTSNIDMILVTETLENLDVCREFVVSRARVYDALRWLIENNPLYKDVVIDNTAQINQNDLIRLSQPPNQQPANAEEFHAPPHVVNYVNINNDCRILRASWHQADHLIFASGYAGSQCCAMVVANIVRAALLPPGNWSTNTLNVNMLEGDALYSKIRMLCTEDPLAPAVDDSGYLEVRHLSVIRDGFHIFDCSASISYADDTDLFGSLQDSANRDFGMTLKQALVRLFVDHSAGALIASSKTLGVMSYEGKFYFTDSHSCGPRGATASPDNGKACVIECVCIDELVRLCKRATGSRNQQFTINSIDVQIRATAESPHQAAMVTNRTQEPMSSMLCDENKSRTELQTLGNEYDNIVSTHEHTSQIQLQKSRNCDHNIHIPIQTSLMLPIDSVQPDVEEELEVSENINQIVRKTKDNIVNDAHETKAEEFAWFYLFPYGRHGFKHSRPVKITALDYFQHRVLGKDTRFQRNDYLFYALSMFELNKVKATIAACGKKVEGVDGGKVEDLHLYLKNLRGSAAYWRVALNDLLAQIRCLGPPTYFVTFSCNDLYWLDMRKALLIADGRPNDDLESLDVYATQKLVEQHPVTVSRHFMLRVHALMKFLKNNDTVLGGPLKDFWWRIEYQNRGSPHLHCVVWIDGHPSFDSEDGLRILDEVCSCAMPPDTSELHELVKKLQVHRHSATCHKNTDATACRFGFPRRACSETRIVAHSSDDFIANNGRMCLLKRRPEDRWINNYNPTLLKVWQANMDIQPCGSNEAIAFYIAKYVSKSEPTQLDSSVALAIRQIQREESDVSRKLFKVCMRLLKERQVSANECVQRLCHLQFRDSSRKCIFLNARKPEQRYKVLKFDGDQAVGYCANLFDRYEKRPANHPDYDFDNMCLLEFAMNFEPHYAKANQENDESVDCHEPEIRMRRRLIALSDNTKMVVRNVPAVVRVPYFVAATDPENYYYSLLVQYVPYRSERELLEAYDSAREAFLAREAELRGANERLEIYRERDRQLEIAFTRIHAFDILDQELDQDHVEEDELVPEQPMPDNQFQNACRAMNIGQRAVFTFVTRSITEQMHGSIERLKVFITGNAGTGKTFLFNMLKQQILRCYGKPVVKVCALTGVAARLVGGSTLHSTLRLPVQKDGRIVQMPLLTGNYLRVMRKLWQDVEFLFIDEISMVPYEMLCMVDSRLKQLKNSEQIFGGINICVFGDLLQLPPVRGNQVFAQPERLLPAVHLWRQFSLIELTENMRQQGSDVFVDVLNALRIGELRAEHFAVLMSKVNQEASGEFAVDKALRIYPTNAQVQAHNEAVLQLYTSMGTEIHKIRAQDNLVDNMRKNDTVDLEKVIPSDVNKTGGLPKDLHIFVGAKVMLRSNIDVAKGLVNGAIGHIVEIIWPCFRRAQMYDTDIPSVRVDFGNDGVHVIQPKSVQFDAKFSYGTAERRMLPLVLCWASTVHKMQGCTVDRAVVYLGTKLFASGQAYVALSRVRSLDGLRIEDLECSRLTGKRPCNNDALEEMDRLRSLPCPTQS